MHTELRVLRHGVAMLWRTTVRTEPNGRGHPYPGGVLTAYATRLLPLRPLRRSVHKLGAQGRAAGNDNPRGARSFAPIDTEPRVSVVAAGPQTVTAGLSSSCGVVSDS